MRAAASPGRLVSRPCRRRRSSMGPVWSDGWGPRFHLISTIASRPRCGRARTVQASDAVARERAILVGVVLPHMRREEGDDHLDELARLTETAGGTVVERLLQDRDTLDAAYFVGRGKAHEIGTHARGRHADLII